MFSQTQHIFFDLDRTIWDFDKNSELTILEMFEHYQLKEKLGADYQTFLSKYKIINEWCWDMYRQNKMTKVELRRKRFGDTMIHFGHQDDALATTLDKHYVDHAPFKQNLYPEAHEVLDYLANKYTLHLITNGFKEAQLTKITNCDLGSYFDKVVISEDCGYIKPEREIFEHAMKLASTEVQNSIMIGDDYKADILGAKNVGMQSVFFDHEKLNKEDQITIHQLADLYKLL